jgi:hypothetical protein
MNRDACYSSLLAVVVEIVVAVVVAVAVAFVFAVVVEIVVVFAVENKVAIVDQLAAFVEDSVFRNYLKHQTKDPVSI